MSKVEKNYPDFVNEVAVLTTEQLKARVVQLQQTLSESEQHKEENDALRAARDELAVLSGPYRDVKTAVKLKTAYILDLLRQKGA